MARTALHSKLLLLSLAVLTAGLAGVGWLAGEAVESAALAGHASGLEAQARLLGLPVETALAALDRNDPAAHAALRNDCAAWSRRTQSRITVLNAAGWPAADSNAPDLIQPADANLAALPEFAAAAKHGVGVARRLSLPDQAERQFVAIHLTADGHTLGFVRVDRSVDPFVARVHALWLECMGAWVVLALLTLVLYRRLQRRIELPLHEIGAGVERFAQGQFHPPIGLSYPDDDPGLADSLNRMAAQLNDRINTALRQRNEQEAILSSMIEGVVAIDDTEKVITLNAVAARLFGGSVESLRGKLFQEISRIPALHEFVGRTLSSESPQEGEFTHYEHSQLRYLQAHGAALRDAAGRRLGAVIVLHDNTRLRRLESLQREFVANVSHELKTPVTSIQGFIETLQDGALADPAEARKFLDIVARQADRLGAIIEDLLMLSRMDQDADGVMLERRPVDLRSLVDAAVEQCAARAAASQIALQIEAVPTPQVAVNERLMLQVIVNLIDNAVKYSDPGRTVELRLASGDNEVTLAIRDHGCGIPAEHLARLGERFYRVDTARSRKQGGTGLGLAIARQILQAHGGRLTVTSTVDLGSTFTLHLPALAPA